MAGRYNLEQLPAVAEDEAVGVLRQQSTQLGLERIPQVRSEPIMHGETRPLRLGDDARQLLGAADDLLDKRRRQAGGNARDARRAPYGTLRR